MRVVVDTNVLVSSALVPGGPPARLVLAWIEDRFQLITSPELLAELQRVLTRPRVVRRILTSDGSILLEQLDDRAEVVHPSVRLEVVRDPDDDRVLEAAVAGMADVIVSGDRDLLDLGEYEGISIVTAAQFLAMLDEFEQLE